MLLIPMADILHVIPPEYVSDALTAWASRRGIQIEFMQLSKPQQNAYIERYNDTVRYD